MSELKNFDRSENSYSDNIDYGNHYDKAVFKIFSEFFNILSQNKEKQKEYGINLIGFVSGSNLEKTCSFYEDLGIVRVIMEFEGLKLLFSFNIYLSNNKLYHRLTLTSKETTKLKSHKIFEYLFHSAIKESDLKGNYLVLEADFISWEKKELEKRSFDDIFLPNHLLNNLYLLKNVFKKDKELFRYLMVGNPGTGKTEATLVLANELNKEGVTVIKTSIGDEFSTNIKIAKVLAPSLIILDDIDLTLGSRSKGSYDPKKLKIFLDELDGTEKIDKQVGFLATTNSAELLDLAAQRPGRFDEIMLFDSLSKKNIEGVILKSLKYNFNITEGVEYNIFSDSKIIDLFYKKSVTGACIFNSVRMMLKKFNSSNKKISSDLLIKEIERKLNNFDKVKKYGEISDRYKPKSSNIGYGRSNEEDELVNEDILETETLKERTRDDTEEDSTKHQQEAD